MELDHGHESSVALLQSWGSLNPCCKLQVPTGVLSGFSRALVNCAYGAKSIWGESYVSSAVIRVCVGLMSASVRVREKMGFAFAVRQGCRELASEVGRVPERTRFKRSSRTFRARSRALRSIAPDVGLECSSSDEDVMSLAPRPSCADFLEVSLQLLDPCK